MSTPETGAEKEVPILPKREREFNLNTFVGRGNALDALAQMINQIGEERLQKGPLLEVDGSPLIGKTLFKRCAALVLSASGRRFLPEELGDLPPTVSIFVDLGQDRQKDQISAALQQGLKEELGALSDLGITPAESLKEFKAKMLDLTDEGVVPVVIFDNGRSLSKNVFDWLEKEVVLPLIVTDKIVFVWGERRPTCWQEFEIRRKVEPVKLDVLSLGDEETLAKELGFSQSDSRRLAPYLRSFSFGQPLVDQIVLAHLQRAQQKGLSLKEAREDRNIQGEISKAVRQLVDESLLAGLSAELKELLWGASALRYFNSSPLRRFMEKIEPEWGEKPRGYFWEVIGDYQDLGLVSFSTDHHGYIIVPPWRRVMEANVSLRNPGARKEMHEKALDLYADWLEQYPENLAYFLPEWAFHRRRQLHFVGQSAEEAGEIVLKEFKKWLEKARSRDEVQWEWPEIAAELKERLTKEDQLHAGELKDLLGEEVWGELEKEAEKF